jgi:sterol O-acyltransferase
MTSAHDAHVQPILGSSESSESSSVYIPSCRPSYTIAFLRNSCYRALLLTKLNCPSGTLTDTYLGTRLSQCVISHFQPTMATSPSPHRTSQDSNQEVLSGSDESWTPEEGVIHSLDILEPKLRMGQDDVESTPDTDTDTGPVTGLGSGKHRRRKSVQIFIQESRKREGYVLRTNDAEIREILRSGIEREASRSNRKGKNRMRDLVFTRQFTTFDRQNPRASSSPFHGFFTLFWLAMALLLVRIAAQNYRDLGSMFGRAEILHLMVDRDLFVMLTTDGLMCISTTFCLLLQRCISRGYLTWDRSGWIIQSLWEIIFTVAFIWISFYREWSWTHTVFIVMHDFVLLMKQHSYSFYNGYCTSIHSQPDVSDS